MVWLVTDTEGVTWTIILVVFSLAFKILLYQREEALQNKSIEFGFAGLKR